VVANLTTTSYAVLSLLAVRPMTTYELTKQMQRTLRDVWPRAESVIYEEPKRLVAHRLATASTEMVGRRPSTSYTITAKGRRALVRWLDEPGAAPQMEFEGLLKVAFADHGNLEQLRANLASIRDLADERLIYVNQRIAEYRDTGGPYPERLPVIMLVARFQREQAEATCRWVRWAQRQVASWSGTTLAEGARTPRIAT
jgi:DNA-binding PadR family transcriptional regulator